jgi:serine/threonine protein kinase
VIDLCRSAQFAQVVVRSQQELYQQEVGQNCRQSVNSEDAGENRRESPLDEWSFSQKYQIVLEIALGMEYLHSQGFWHRGLDPDVILVDDDFNVIIIGMERAIAGEGFDRTLTIFGEDAFTAPEISSDPKSDYTAMVDVFSFGKIACLVITGGLVIDGNFPFASLIQSCCDPVPEIRPPFGAIVDLLESNEAQSLVSRDGLDRYMTRIGSSLGSRRGEHWREALALSVGSVKGQFGELSGLC